MKRMSSKLMAAVMAGLLAMIGLVPAAGAATATMTKLILSTSEATLETGDTIMLTATGIYSDNSTENVTVYADWNSEKPAVASIYNGTITAKAEGTTTVVVAYKGFTQSANVKVTKKVKALTKDTQKLNLRKDASSTIGLTATYSDNSTENVADKAVWTSSNEKVATVVNGKVTGHSSGSAIVTAAYGTKSVTVETSVEPVSRLETSDTYISLLLKEKETVTVTATYPDGTTRNVTGDAVWTTSDEEVADVINGMLTGYGSGTATITASYGTKTATIKVDVDKTTKLDLDADEVFLHAKGTKKLKLTARNTEGAVTDVTDSATWKSSNEAVAYVNKGTITAYKSGSAVITAEYNGKSVQANVDVDVVRRLDISNSQITMLTDETANVTLTATYADGSSENVTSKAAWSSDNEDAAYAAKGVVTAYKSGRAVIKGTFGGKSATAAVSVDLPAKLTTSSKSTNLEIGAKYQADAIAVFADDKEIVVTDSATWSSSDETIATVKGGVIAGIASGTATIVAAYGEQTVVMTVNVANARRIEADKPKVSLVLKGAETIKLTATYPDGSTKDVTALADWASSDETVAGAANGKITGNGAGTATITVSYGAKTATIAVDVDKTANLSVSEQSVFLRLNGEKQLQLSVKYADGRTADVTDSAVWSSSNEAVAFVSKGKITGYKSGTATVKAEFNGKAVETIVDVETARNLDISADKLALKTGELAVVTLTATYADGTKENVTAKAVWSSDKEEVAFVRGGQISAYKMGAAAIKGAYGGKSATVAVSVDLPDKLTVTSKTVNLDANGEHQSVATAFYADNRTQIVTKDATWSTADAAVAIVKDGLIMGVEEGSTAITVTYGGQTVKIIVNVGLSDELDPSTRLVTLSGLDSQQVRLFATNADGVRQDVTNEAKWQSSKPSIADVRGGLIQAYSKGTATVSATYGGKSVAITVQVDQIARIDVSELGISLKTGKSRQVSVIVKFNDGKTKNVTAEAEWDTSNFRVATVKNGFITATGAGKATITAKYAGKSVRVAVDVDTLKYFETSVVSLSMKVGEQVQVKALATYADQSEEDVTKPSLWESSKITVVTVKDGIVKANGKGKATITVSYGDKKTKIVVEVK